MASFDGSVGIVANASSSPDELYLALRGSGQSLNIGLAEDAFIIASEPYGLVEETKRYLRMDGEKGGQVVMCSQAGAGPWTGSPAGATTVPSCRSPRPRSCRPK